jgi:TusA-related sulfurtransferase
MAEVVEVDAVGLACPQPVIELAATIEQVAVGDRVRLRADDVAAKVDVPVWCRMKRHRLESADEIDGVWVFLVRKEHPR